MELEGLLQFAVACRLSLYNKTSRARTLTKGAGPSESGWTLFCTEPIEI